MTRPSIEWNSKCQYARAFLIVQLTDDTTFKMQYNTVVTITPTMRKSNPTALVKDMPNEKYTHCTLLAHVISYTEWQTGKQPRVTCILIGFCGTFGEVHAIAEHGIGWQTGVEPVVFDRLELVLFRPMKQKVLVDFSDETLAQLAATCSERNATETSCT